MIPSDYHLDHVSARLIERLEGTRRSHSQPEQASVAFERIAGEHVAAALDEAEEYVSAEELAHHTRFLREEIHSTFLPRYLRLACEMTADEERGYGLGLVVKPLGRLLLVGLAAALLVLLSRFLYSPVAWPLLLLDLSLPFWPDVVAGLRRRQYRKQLESLLADMTRIQEQAAAYGIPDAQPQPRLVREPPESLQENAQPAPKKREIQ